MIRSADLFAGAILLGAIGFLGAPALNVAERRRLAGRATLVAWVRAFRQIETAACRLPEEGNAPPSFRHDILL
jgi:hypothetical protein